MAEVGWWICDRVYGRWDGDGDLNGNGDGDGDGEDGGVGHGSEVRDGGTDAIGEW